MNNIKRLADACQKAAYYMAEQHAVSHSFNVLMPESRFKACTMLMVFVPSRLDHEIYQALKPIFDREFGPGSLVEPGKEAQKAVQSN